MPFGLPPEYVEEIAPSIPEISAEAFHVENSKRYDPGFEDVSSFTATIYEDDKGAAMAWFLRWRAAVSSDGFYGRPSEYKRAIHLTLQDAKGNVATTATADGCWPTTASPYTMQSESSDRLRLEVTFSVDAVTWNADDSGGGRSARQNFADRDLASAFTGALT